MFRSKQLHILDCIEQSLDNKQGALAVMNTIKDAKVRGRVESLLRRIHHEYISKDFVESNINSLNNQILEYAQNNYYSEVPLTECNDSIDSLITSMNMLGEEINYSTVSRLYFTDIYNTIPDFVLVVDDKGTINNANQAFLNTFNIDKNTIIKQKNICEFIKDECDYQHLISAIEDGDNYRSLQIEDHEDLPITIKMGGFTTSNNGMACRVFIFRDFTEVLRYQRDLEAALQKAQESDRLKSAFLANMSHEIRTPMNGILGFTELLKTTAISEDKKNQFIALIQSSGHRMLNTVTDIIEISKIQSGQMTLVLSDFDLEEELNILFRSFEKIAQSNNLQFVVNQHIDRDNRCIRTDKSKLLSILSKLINNAIKFTDEGSVTVDCKKDKEVFYCTITDTGVGIPPERQEAIFDSFVQADIEDIRAHQGAGLGLAISKAHIAMLGGKISLNSSKDQGSCFAFSVPCHSPNESYERINSFDFDDENNPEWTILVAEDDIINYEYLKNLLESKCKKILWAQTGVESLNYVKTHADIDFVLMDIRMPGMDGYEATKRIKKLRPLLPVIAQTAYALPEDKEKAMRAGCNGFLAKPLDINKLKLILKDL